MLLLCSSVACDWEDDIRKITILKAMSIIVFLVSKLRNSGVQLNFNFTFDIKSQKQENEEHEYVYIRKIFYKYIIFNSNEM